MVNEFCGFKHGVIGTDKMPADTTLNNMKKEDLIKLLHTAQHNYETLMWFYNNAVKVNMSQLNNNGWVPCSERLPIGEEYRKIFDGSYYYKHMLTTTNEIDIPVCVGWYDQENEIWCDLEGFAFYPIAWQPLPAPYKKGE